MKNSFLYQRAEEKILFVLGCCGGLVIFCGKLEKINSLPLPRLLSVARIFR